MVPAVTWLVLVVVVGAALRNGGLGKREGREVNVTMTGGEQQPGFCNHLLQSTAKHLAHRGCEWPSLPIQWLGCASVSVKDRNFHLRGGGSDLGAEECVQVVRIVESRFCFQSCCNTDNASVCLWAEIQQDPCSSRPGVSDVKMQAIAECRAR